MPYIKQEDRNKLDNEIQNILESLTDFNRKPFSEGELNYIISSVVWTLFNISPSYSNANKLLGVLSAVDKEFYRRKVGVLEDKKIIENGDI